MKVAEYPPFASGVAPGLWNGTAASAYPTRYSGIDVYGRPTTKTVLRNAAALFQAGSGDAALTTTYAYSVVPEGVQTDIAVSKAASQGGALHMIRVFDRRGKLISTSQSVTVAPAHSIQVRYFYEPAGNLTSVLDGASNSIAATYDDLGRKLTVNDPDRGLWQYTWDGLSRLRTQTDARGVVLDFEYDADGRSERRFTQPSPGGAATLEANWQYDLNSKPGTVGAVLGVADGFRRDYRYDSLLRPWSEATHIPAGSAGANAWGVHDFTVEYGYDRNFGRTKAQRYASGEIVGLDYDSRGNPLGETPLGVDGSRLTPSYRVVTGMSERGQVTNQAFGNGITETDMFDASTGMPLQMNAYGLHETQPTGCAATLLAREVDYHFDQFLNVASQSKQFLKRDPNTALIQFAPGTCNPVGVTANEAYGYDELQRLRSATRSWTGLNPGVSTVLADAYAYDDLGNLTTKSDYGDTYVSGTSARAAPSFAGPHAVVSVTKGGVTKPAFSYDPNGNMVVGDNRTVTFDNLDRPVTVVTNGFTTQFRYEPDGERYLQSAVSAAGTTNEYYDGKMYERVETASTTVERTYVGASVLITRSGSSRAVRYKHLDRLGSLDAVTREDASEDPTDAHGYDAFGKPRPRDWQSTGDATSWQMQPGTGVYTTERGFTGHEHLDELYLIHMNGRIYDYRLGRFLSVDPIISNPASTQSLNAYSYIGNNPLSGVDPTGFAPAIGGMTDCKFQKCDVIVVNDPAAPVKGKVAAGPPSKGPESSGSKGQGSGSIPVNSPTAAQGSPQDNNRKQVAETGGRSEVDPIRTSDGMTYGEALEKGVIRETNPARVSDPDAIQAFVAGGGKHALVKQRTALEILIAVVTFGFGGGGTMVEGAAAEGGVLADANFAQRTFNQFFDLGGRFAGRTVEEVAAALRSGEMAAADVPVQYILRDGNTLMLNTRSAQALEAAGIPRAQWNAINVTGDVAAELRLTGQLERNGLDSQGIPTVTPGGK